MRNSPAKITFWRGGVCNFHTIGNGAIRIAKSVTIHGTGTILSKRYWFPQWPGIAVFHTELIGSQINAAPNVIAMYHAITMIVKIPAVKRNA